MMKTVVDECVFLRVCSVTEHGGGGGGRGGSLTVHQSCSPKGKNSNQIGEPGGLVVWRGSLC